MKMTTNNFALFYRDYFNNAKFSGVNVDTSYRCPLQCPFCIRQKEGADKKISASFDIPVESFQKLVNFSDEFNLCGQISDPIYHADFLSLMKIIDKYPNKKFSIHTTATRKKLAWWKEVFSLSQSKKVKWIFGLDGTDQEAANIYRINTRFDEVMDVMKLGVSMGVHVEWQFIVFKHNEHQLEEAIRLSNEHSLNLRVIKSNRWSPKKVEQYQIYPPSQKWVTSDGSISQRIFLMQEKK